MKTIILDILICAYGEEKANKKLEQHLLVVGNTYTIAKLINKFGVEKAKELFLAKVKQDSKRGTLQYYVEKYGEEDGLLKYKEKNSKLSVGVNALKLSGKTDEEIEKIKKTHSSKSAINIKNYIDRFGFEEGTRKFKEWESTHSYRSCWSVDFYTSRGVSKEDAILLISKKQIRDYAFFKERDWTDDQYIDYCKRKTIGFRKEYYIEKYGEIDGEARYYFDKTKGCSLEFLIEQHGLEKGQDVFNKILKSKITQARDSKIQLEFSKLLYDNLPEYLQKKYYGMPITQGFWLNYDKNEFDIRCSIPDIRIGNILIEFDGTYWHNLQETQDKDLKKMILNYRCGFSTIRVWEHSYNEDKIGIINSIITKINNLYNSDFKWYKK